MKEDSTHLDRNSLLDMNDHIYCQQQQQQQQHAHIRSEELKDYFLYLLVN